MSRSSNVPIGLCALGRAAWLLPVVVLALGSAAAAEVTLTPSADAFLFAGEPASNYGGAGQLAVSDASRPQGEYQSLMRFDLAGAKSSFDAMLGSGTWALQSAALRLTTSNPNNAIFNLNQAGTFSISRMGNDSWVEGAGSPTAPAAQGVAFTAIPSLIGPEDRLLGTFNFPGGNSGANTFALGPVLGLMPDLESGGELTLRLFADAGATVSYNFSSRTFQNVASRPALTLTAVAIPEPAGLLPAGTLGLLLSRRRRRG